MGDVDKASPKKPTPPTLASRPSGDQSHGKVNTVLNSRLPGTSAAERPFMIEEEGRMPEKTAHGPRPRDKNRPSGQTKPGLMQSLKDAHELDHKILEALGIKHPHIPILSVLEVLDHLRDEHAQESSREKRADPKGK